MVKKLLTYLVLVLALFISLESRAAVSNNEPVLFISYETDSNTEYTGQIFPVKLVLYSSTPDVTFADKLSNLTLKKGEFSVFRRLDNRTRAYTKNLDGKKYYCFTLETYLISFSKPGNYEFNDRSFEIGVSFPVVLKDPFWGTYRSSETKTYNVKVKNFSVKIKNLPSPPDGTNFSGAIGLFNVETIVPKGNIIVNEEATAYIVVKGYGKFEESAMPEYKSAFSNGLRLKSVSEERNEYLENGRLVSEIRLECSFLPEKEGELEIGKVSFDYFDTKTGKYTRADSKPVTINVKSSVSKRDKMSI